MVQLAAGALAKEKNPSQVGLIRNLSEESCQLLRERRHPFQGMPATPGQSARGLHCLKQRESEFLFRDAEGEILIGGPEHGRRRGEHGTGTRLSFADITRHGLFPFVHRRQPANCGRLPHNRHSPSHGRDNSS